MCLVGGGIGQVFVFIGDIVGIYDQEMIVFVEVVDVVVVIVGDVGLVMDQGVMCVG